jgi:hypothetical protein
MTTWDFEIRFTLAAFLIGDLGALGAKEILKQFHENRLS